MNMSKYLLRNMVGLSRVGGGSSRLEPLLVCPGRFFHSCILCLLSAFLLSSCFMGRAGGDADYGVVDDEVLSADVQDVIYNVERDGELLSEVVEWFTADINNTAAVARINDLPPNSFLMHGQFLRIPKYMLKER